MKTQNEKLYYGYHLTDTGVELHISPNREDIEKTSAKVQEVLFRDCETDQILEQVESWRHEMNRLDARLVGYPIERSDLEEDEDDLPRMHPGYPIETY